MVGPLGMRVGRQRNARPLSQLVQLTFRWRSGDHFEGLSRRAERHNLVTIRIVGRRDKLSIWDRPTQTQDETGGWFSVAS